jgi:2-hydroxy-3-keto-5-methylthiopentenyl-1-phosphate phosphatase
MRAIVICDFDGTIVNVDTGELILSKFADGDWRALDELYHRNEMSSEEVISRQFAMVKAPKTSMITAVEEEAHIRPGFNRLLEVCRERHVPFLVVSYGLDFCIRHFLAKVPQGGYARIFAPMATVTSNGVSFAFPRRRLSHSENMKVDVVKYYKGRGCQVVFAGDSTSDMPAAASADTRFAVKGSRLEEFCEREDIEYTPITDFGPVTAAMERMTRP